MPGPAVFADASACVDATLARLGKRIVLGLPVGLGKPVPFVNALVDRACRDPTLRLTILTALSFRVPKARGDLDRRFLEPLTHRLFGSPPPLAYLELLERGALPANIEVVEFFLDPGAWTQDAHLQQHYLSTNYTHVIRDALARGLNVLAQMVAPPPAGEQMDGHVSLSCNPDLAVDLLPHVAAARAEGRSLLLVGQVHRELPFMYGDAVVPVESFDFLIDAPGESVPLFTPPNPPIGTTDHLIGLAVSALIKDGGTLQLGIGELGDAVVHALLLRHRQPAIYRQTLERTGLLAAAGPLIESEGGTQPFERGLYGCSEMLADGFVDLFDAGVLKREVYPSARIQRLIDSGSLSARLDAGCLDALRDIGMRRLSYVDFVELRDIGLLREHVHFEDGRLRVADERIEVDLDDPASRQAIATLCLGRELRGGSVLDAGFFFGPAAFLGRLRDMPAGVRRRFAMRGISFINDLQGPEAELKAAQRRHARFVNTTMMVTALGSAVSDTLADGRVVSGVGGQYNFVAMAHALPEARSILCLRSTRRHRGKLTSNIVWNGGQPTIPRHLRDIVVTEYGIADIRGRTDAETIVALIGIADSRFQQDLVDEARRAGKLPRDYRIPDAVRGNLPERLEDSLVAARALGHFAVYPFGTDLTAEEQALAPALRWLQAATASPPGRARTVLRAVMQAAPDGSVAPLLARLQLQEPRTLHEWLLRRLVTLALRQTTTATRLQ